MEKLTVDFSDDDVSEFAATDISFHDYLKQFDGKHAEWLVDKVVVFSHNVKHQEILGFLNTLLVLYLGFNKIGKLLLASFTMYLGDTQPAREPDIMIVLNENTHRIQPTYLEGAADICIEIVSPESMNRDYSSKFLQYEAAGVREYWRIDPIRKLADFYVLRDVDGEMHYQRITPDAQGRFVSTLLPNFALDPNIFWRDELPAGMELVELVQVMTPR